MIVNGRPLRPIAALPSRDAVQVIDQRLLPHELRMAVLATPQDVFTAIRDMWVRGAPLIGACAAYALALDLPWVLVLDNAQELGAASALHAGIAAALAELPERARVIAISREPPPPEYARALANQQLVLLDETSLRFTEADTQQLVGLQATRAAATAWSARAKHRCCWPRWW